MLQEKFIYFSDSRRNQALFLLCFMFNTETTEIAVGLFVVFYIDLFRL